MWKHYGEESVIRQCLYFENSPSSVLRKLLIVQEQTRISMGFVSKLKQLLLQGHYETFFPFLSCHFLTWIVRGSLVWWVYPSVSKSQFTSSKRHWIIVLGQFKIIIVINCWGQNKKNATFRSPSPRSHMATLGATLLRMWITWERKLRGAVWSHMYLKQVMFWQLAPGEQGDVVKLAGKAAENRFIVTGP